MMQRNFNFRTKENPYVFVLPIIILIFVISIYPTIYAFRNSLYSTAKGIKNPEFVGLKNFWNLLKSGDFWKFVRITLEFTVIAVIVEMFFGFLLALLLRSITVGRIIFRSIFIISLAVTPTIAGLTWRMMFNDSYGVLNALLRRIGIEGILWHASAKTAILSVVLVDAWQWTPFVMIIIYAGLQTIPKELIEAAKIDGCSDVKVFFEIELPYIKPVVLLVLLFRFLDAFKAFDLLYVITRGGPGEASTTLVIKGFVDAFFNMRIGSASAISILLLIISIILTQRVLKIITN